MKRVENDNQSRIIRRIRSSCAVTAAAVLTALGLLAGCAQTAPPAAPGSEEQAAEAGAVQAAEETAPEGTEAAAPSEEAATEAADAAEASSEAAQEAPEIDELALSAELTIRVGMLKNPGAFGLVAVMDAQEIDGEVKTPEEQEIEGETGTEETQEQPGQPEAGQEEPETSEEEPETVASSNFILYDSMQELADQFRQEELDAAILPANIAAVLYQQTEGGVLAADLCTLNSLTCVTGSEDIHSVKDFAGRTVVMTGQGTAAEYSLKYLLKLCGIEDCTILFASDGLEIAGL